MSNPAPAPLPRLDRALLVAFDPGPSSPRPPLPPTADKVAMPAATSLCPGIKAPCGSLPGATGGLLPEQGEGRTVWLQLSWRSRGQAALPQFPGKEQESAGCNSGQKLPGLPGTGGPSCVPASFQGGGFQRRQLPKLQVGLDLRLSPSGPDPARGENPALCPGTAQSIPGDLAWEGG